MIKVSPFRIALAMGSIALAGCGQQPSYHSDSNDRPRAYQEFRGPVVASSQRPLSTGTYVGTIHRIDAPNRGDSYNHMTVRLDSGGYQTIAIANIADLRTGDRVRVDGGYVYRN